MKLLALAVRRCQGQAAPIADSLPHWQHSAAALAELQRRQFAEKSSRPTRRLAREELASEELASGASWPQSILATGCLATALFGSAPIGTPETVSGELGGRAPVARPRKWPPFLPIKRRIVLESGANTGGDSISTWR